MPDLDDILAALGTVSVAAGVGLVVGELVSVIVGVGSALIALGVVALIGFELIRRSAPRSAGRQAAQ